MSETKFVPGPWFVNGVIQDPVGKDTLAICHDEYSIVAVAYRGYESDENGGRPSYANANLIAAAPDLYEALEQCLSSIEGPLWTAAHEALAKARGER